MMKKLLHIVFIISVLGCATTQRPIAGSRVMAIPILPVVNCLQWIWAPGHSYYFPLNPVTTLSTGNQSDAQQILFFFPFLWADDGPPVGLYCHPNRPHGTIVYELHPDGVWQLHIIGSVTNYKDLETIHFVVADSTGKNFWGTADFYTLINGVPTNGAGIIQPTLVSNNGQSLIYGPCPITPVVCK